MAHDDLETLHQLQHLDEALTKMTKNPQNSDEGVQLEHEKGRYSRWASRAEEAEAAFLAAKRRLRQLEMELQAFEEAVRENERRLYSGEVTNPKELRGLSERIDRDRERKLTLEEHTLAAMEEVEQAEIRLAECRLALEQARESLEHANRSFEAAQREWQKESRRLNAARRKLRSAVRPKLLSIYDALYDRCAGRPVARVDHGACGGCHVELPTAMKKPKDDGIMRCPNCGRLLFWK